MKTEKEIRKKMKEMNGDAGRLYMGENYNGCFAILSCVGTLMWVLDEDNSASEENTIKLIKKILHKK